MAKDFYKAIESDLEYQEVKKGLEYIYYSASIYVFLRDKIKADNGTIPVTEFMYENYYGIRVTKSNKKWIKDYFSFLNENYTKTLKPTFEEVLDNDNIGICNNGVQPSFVSKLVHTLNNDAPIYDRYVRIAIGLGDVKGDIEQRKTMAKDIYRDINTFYDDEKYKVLRNQMVKVFDELCVKKYGTKADIVYSISITKKIDFILWLLGMNSIKINAFMD